MLDAHHDLHASQNTTDAATDAHHAAFANANANVDAGNTDADSAELPTWTSLPPSKATHLFSAAAVNPDQNTIIWCTGGQNSRLESFDFGAQVWRPRRGN